MSSSSGGPSSSGGSPPITYHGRDLSGDLPSQSKLGEHLKGTVRKRRNSIRRLDREVLGKLSMDESNPTVQKAAERELIVRKSMEDISKDQVDSGSTHGHRMRATKPVSSEGVDAMRFAQSLAQEASDHAGLRAGDVPKMMGVAEVDGAIGVGFSGGSRRDTQKSQDLMDAMIGFNAFAKTQPGLPVSTHFQAVQTPEVLPEVSPGTGSQPDRERVCAVHRATAAAMSMNGQLSPHQPVAYSDLPTDISAMETTHTPFSEASGASLKSHFDPEAQGMDEPPVPYRRYRRADRDRSPSLDNIVKSCSGCMEELDSQMKKRGGHA